MVVQNWRDEDLACATRKTKGSILVSIMFLNLNNLKCRKFYKIVCCFILCKMPLVQCVLNVKTLLPQIQIEYMTQVKCASMHGTCSESFLKA